MRDLLKIPRYNAKASIYYFINFYYVLQRKLLIQYKDITKGQVHKDLKTGPLSQIA